LMGGEVGGTEERKEGAMAAREAPRSRARLRA
jgi:hypothetical protein